MQKYSHMYTANQFAIKKPKIYNGKIVYLVNGARKTGQPHANEWNCTTILHQNVNSKWITKMSTQNGLKTWIYDLKP